MTVTKLDGGIQNSKRLLLKRKPYLKNGIKQEVQKT